MGLVFVRSKEHPSEVSEATCACVASVKVERGHGRPRPASGTELLRQAQLGRRASALPPVLSAAHGAFSQRFCTQNI